MDQVKAILAGIKKYHFWILCVILIVVGLTSWYMSTSSLHEETVKNAAEIKTKVTEVEAIGKINPHPNNGFLEGMDKVIDGYSTNLALGWKHRYDQQKSLLVWPPGMGQDFIAAVNPLRPIEEHVTYDDKGYIASQEIDPEFRERYRYFITAELPKLAATIQSKWSAKVGEARSSGGQGMSSGGYGGSSMKGSSMKGGSSRSGQDDEDEDKDRSVVRWNPANQQEILDVHFGFASEEAIPHTLDVLYAQEDLWVLQAIVDVIKRTNGDADANYSAAIKEIESLQMGRTVKGRLGQVALLGQTGGGGMSGGGMSPPGGSMSPPGGSMSPPGGSMSPPSGSMSPPSGSMSPPAGGSSSPMGGSSMGPTGGSSMGPTPGGGSSSSMQTQGPVDPAIGRYVDIDYNPLDPKTLRDARTSQDPKLAIYSVAKRMPVLMRLKIDQRRLNDLLAECGNSSLPIEVRQVRINCDAAAGNDSRGSARGSSGGSSSMGPAPGGSSMGPAPGSSSMGPAPGGKSSSSGSKSMGKSGGFRQRGQSDGELSVDPNVIVVDIYGIVHIYNPLNQKQLNTNLREDGTVPEAEPVTPTAATPVAAPARS